MKQKILITITLSFILLLSCTANNDCLTADSVEQIRSFDVNSHAYFVYVRISGFQEKETYFELYDNVPVFDDCGKPNIPIVAAVHVDPTQGVVSKIVIDDKNLKIVYKKNRIEAIGYDRIPIEIKRR
ncbi:MAG: hypothetical protein PVG41_09685 [Desulfobacteraceae bacterium]|jgi:hypothetical protein